MEVDGNFTHTYITETVTEFFTTVYTEKTSNWNDSTGAFNKSDEQYPWPPRNFAPWSLYVQIIVACICCLIVAVTIIGNVLVIYSYFTTKRLRNYANYYVCGLAFTDLLDGCVVMPLFCVFWITGSWPFSDRLCEIYKYLSHVLLHTPAMFTLIICIDRYRALVHPLSHLKERTLRHAIFMMFIAWTIPIISWMGPLIIWPAVANLPPQQFTFLCYPDYSRSTEFSIFVFFYVSWLPIIIIGVLYYRVYVIINKSGIMRAKQREGTESVFDSEKNLVTKNISRIISRHMRNNTPDNREKMMFRDQNGHVNNAYEHSESQDDGETSGETGSRNHSRKVFATSLNTLTECNKENVNHDKIVEMENDSFGKSVNYDKAKKQSSEISTKNKDHDTQQEVIENDKTVDHKGILKTNSSVQNTDSERIDFTEKIITHGANSTVSIKDCISKEINASHTDKGENVIETPDREQGKDQSRCCQCLDLFTFNAMNRSIDESEDSATHTRSESSLRSHPKSTNTKSRKGCDSRRNVARLQRYNVRATRILTLIFVVVLVTRIPWSVVGTLSRLCGGACLPPHFYQVKFVVSAWL